MTRTGARKITTAAVLLLSIAVCGCSKDAIFESTVVDGSHKPLSRVRVIAHKVEPVQGYENAEAYTDASGRFRLEKLHPSASYALSFMSGDWETQANFTIQTGPQRTVKFMSPFQIRFMRTTDGVIRDSRTGLFWAPDTGDTRVRQCSLLPSPCRVS